MATTTHEMRDGNHEEKREKKIESSCIQREGTFEVIAHFGSSSVIWGVFCAICEWMRPWIIRIQRIFAHDADKYLMHWSKEWHLTFGCLTRGIVSLFSVASGFVVSTFEELWSTTTAPGCCNYFCIYLECRVWMINVSFWNCCTSPISHHLNLARSVSSICHECCLSPSHWMWCEMFINFGEFRETDDWFSSTLLGNEVNVFWNKTTLNNALESNLHVSLRLKSRKKEKRFSTKMGNNIKFRYPSMDKLNEHIGESSSKSFWYVLLHGVPLFKWFIPFSSTQLLKKLFVSWNSLKLRNVSHHIEWEGLRQHP